MTYDRLADRAAQLHQEQGELSKAQWDITQGWHRLRNQEQVLSRLQASGRNTREAERLVLLTKGILLEWEKHRELIEQRIAHLESEIPGA
jgi:hypothetical protein